jgi:hypothetical protein
MQLFSGGESNYFSSSAEVNRLPEMFLTSRFTKSFWNNLHKGPTASRRSF